MVRIGYGALPSLENGVVGSLILCMKLLHVEDPRMGRVYFFHYSPCTFYLVWQLVVENY